MDGKSLPASVLTIRTTLVNRRQVCAHVPRHFKSCWIGYLAYRLAPATVCSRSWAMARSHVSPWRRTAGQESM